VLENLIGRFLTGMASDAAVPAGTAPSGTAPEAGAKK